LLLMPPAQLLPVGMNGPDLKAQPVKARGAQHTGQANLLIELLPPGQVGAPTVPVDFTPSLRARAAAPQDTNAANVAIYQYLTFPAAGDDGSYPGPRRWLVVDQQPIPLTLLPASQITTNSVPRAAVVSSYAKARAAPPDIPANVIVFQTLVAPKPFIAIPDYAQPVKARGAQDTGQRNLLPYLLAPIPLPAMPPDLTQRRSSKGVSTQDTQQPNGLIVLNAPTLLPFFSVDLTPNLRPRAPQTQDTAQRNLLTFLLAPVPLPFIGVDLGQPRVGARPQDDATPNLLTSTLTAQASPPFALRDWPVVLRRAIPQDTQQSNDLVVLQAPNLLPLLAVDLTPSLRAKAPQTQDTGQRNLLLYLLVPVVPLVGDPRFEVVLPPLNYVVYVGADDNA
jgi:hypothetical protein